MLSLFASPEEVELLRLRRFYGTPTVAVAGDEQVHPPRRLDRRNEEPLGPAATTRRASCPRAT